MSRWAKVKAEVIKAVKEGLMGKKRKIKGDGFWIWVKYSKGVIDLLIYLSSGSGDFVKIPDLGIDMEVLKAMRMGWRASDSSDDNDKYPIMGTVFVWQALAWMITYPNTETWIYAQGISISMDGIKPVWELKVSSFEVEWPDDITVYREVAKLPRDLLAIAILHAVFGDGHSMIDDGVRLIRLSNDDRGALEAVKARLEEEFRVKGSIGPDTSGWRYSISSSSAKNLAEASVKAMEELAPAVKRLYDLVASERHELIQFKKWTVINRTSRYITDETKVLFANVWWSPHFTNGGIELLIQTKDVNYVERIRREVEVQGIDVTIAKSIRKDRNEVYYNVKINWSVLRDISVIIPSSGSSW